MTTTTLRSTAIHCGNCAGRVRAALSQHPGVHAVDADPDAKLVWVEFDQDQTSPDKLAEQMTQAGYPVDEIVQR